MDVELVAALARKDMRQITRNVQVWLPMTILPIVIGIVVPTALVAGLAYGDTAKLTTGPDAEQLRQWVDKLPISLRDFPTLVHGLAYGAANYVFAPFFLLIPLMTSSVVSADSFAGEKERGTLESLLFSPVDLPTLFVGKLAASLVPALALSWGTFLVAAVAVNVAGWPLFHRVFFPTLPWAPLLLLVIPAVSLGATLLTVFVSAKVSTFQAAYQLGGVVVLPVLLLVAGQLTGLLFLSATVVTGVGLVLAGLDVLGLRLLLRRMDRAKLFETQVR